MKKNTNGFVNLMQMARNWPSRTAVCESFKGLPASVSEMAPAARRLIGDPAMGAMLDAIEWDKVIPGPKWAREKFTPYYKLLVAEMLRRTLKSASRNPKALEAEYEHAQESTLAGSGGIPTFGRQLIKIISKAYPRMIAPQLFPVAPLQGPEGRIYFELIKYGTAFSSSAPNISSGDLVSDLTKFNVGYANKGQTLAANEVDYDLSNYVLVSSEIKRLTNTRSVEADIDLEDFDGDDLETVIRGKLDWLLKWITDRDLIQAAAAAVPTANVVQWDATGYGSHTEPSEKMAWYNTLWAKAASRVKRLIFETRFIEPNWVICGPKAAEYLMRVKTFVALERDAYNLDVRTGAISDMGSVEAGQTRVLKDPQFQTNAILFGYRPESPMEPAVHFCPRRPVTFFPQLIYPNTATKVSGAFTMYGIAEPNTGSYPYSSILGECYGKIEINNIDNDT